MEPRFWHQRWENDEIAFHQEHVNAHLQRFWERFGLTAGAAVFVPLCGKSHDLAWLAEQGHPVLGVEISPLAIAAFFREHELPPEIHQEGVFQVWSGGAIQLLCGDFFALDPTHLEGIAGVYDRASLIALPPAMRKGYARHLTAILPPGVDVLLVTLEYPEAQMQGPPFSVTEPEVRSLYQADYRVERLWVHDALPESPRFRDKGLTRLEEKVYWLTPKAASTR